MIIRLIVFCALDCGLGVYKTSVDKDLQINFRLYL